MLARKKIKEMKEATKNKEVSRSASPNYPVKTEGSDEKYDDCTVYMAEFFKCVLYN